MRQSQMSSDDNRAYLKTRRGVFVGAARNCEPHLPGVLENLARLEPLYGETSFIFVVSDSRDDTARILTKWLAAGRRGRVIDLGNLEPQLPLRTQRLAYVRNLSVDEVRQGEEATYDHLIVVDLDDVLAVPISVDIFAKAARWLDASSTRAGVFPNGRPRYYDIWALRHDMWCPHDCWHPVWFRDPRRNIYDIQVREVVGRMLKIPLWMPPIRVLSAFGGIGIYKLRLTLAARYSGLDEQGRETCEHVAFNTSVRQSGGGLYIFPSLVARSPSEHFDQFRSLPRRLRPAVIARRLVLTLRLWLAATQR
jgi:hypothetical protein